MSRRFWFSVALTVPLVLLAMGDLLPGAPISRVFSSMRTRTLLELLLATPVCVWAAWPFYVRAVLSVKNRSLNMFTLIGLGVFYQPSPRPIPSKLPPLDYPGHFEVRYVSFNGGIRWKRDGCRSDTEVRQWVCR